MSVWPLAWGWPDVAWLLASSCKYRRPPESCQGSGVVFRLWGPPSVSNGSAIQQCPERLTFACGEAGENGNDGLGGSCVIDNFQTSASSGASGGWLLRKSRIFRTYVQMLTPLQGGGYR